jgi:hypothetical protein
MIRSLRTFPGRGAPPLGGAALNRDRCTLGVWNDPGSAVQRLALRCVREKHPGLGLRTISICIPPSPHQFHG